MSSAALVPLDPRVLETRLCFAQSCPRDAAVDGRCRRHAAVALESLPGIAERARDEHKAAGRALSESIQHAIRCGEALLEAHTLIKATPGAAWGAWLAESIGISDRYAYGYMRLAVHRDALPAEAFAPYIDGRGRRRDPSVSRAIEFTAHMPAVADKGDHWRIPEEKREEVRRLHAAGGLSFAEIARRVGINHVTVSRILNPELDRRKRAAANRKQRVQTATERAAADADLEQRLAAALAERPDLAETYRLARNLVDGLASDESLKKPYRYAKAARNALTDALLAEVPA